MARVFFLIVICHALGSEALSQIAPITFDLVSRPENLTTGIQLYGTRSTVVRASLRDTDSAVRNALVGMSIRTTSNHVWTVKDSQSSHASASQVRNPKDLSRDVPDLLQEPIPLDPETITFLLPVADPIGELKKYNTCAGIQISGRTTAGDPVEVTIFRKLDELIVTAHIGQPGNPELAESLLRRTKAKLKSGQSR